MEESKPSGNTVNSKITVHPKVLYIYGDVEGE